ncbi:MAG: hypothetical protein NZ108_07205, partial [Bacteroidia bacterium]|nr:hypothetical protein [Bacteroidia bacterium]
MIHYYFLLIFLLGWFRNACCQSLIPSNDNCENPKQLFFNQLLSKETNEFATLASPTQLPKPIPVTCIQSFENELWYWFHTASFTNVKVTIAAKKCNTPLGLQALLFEGKTCNREQYIYKACSNKQTVDTILILGTQLKPNQDYLLLVDGYDGTICEFDILLTGKDFFTTDELKFYQYDYLFQQNLPVFSADFRVKQENNEVKLEIPIIENEDAIYLLEEKKEGFHEVIQRKLSTEKTFSSGQQILS